MQFNLFEVSSWESSPAVLLKIVYLNSTGLCMLTSNWAYMRRANLRTLTCMKREHVLWTLGSHWVGDLSAYFSASVRLVVPPLSYCTSGKVIRALVKHALLLVLHNLLLVQLRSWQGWFISICSFIWKKKAMWVGTTICGIHRLYIRFWFGKKKD